MAIIETVKIVSKATKDGYVIINKKDLTDKHTIFKEKKEIPEAKEISKEKAKTK